jgi:hypothetical protein
LVHPFQEIFETIEVALPESGHLARPIGQRRQRARLRAVMCLTAILAIAYQPGLFQDAQMLRYGWLRDFGPDRQGSDRLLSFAA